MAVKVHGETIGGLVLERQRKGHKDLLIAGKLLAVTVPILLHSPAPLYAQEGETGLINERPSSNTSVPDEVRHIRESQRLLEIEENVDIRTRDVGRQSTTRLNTVPDEIASISINSGRDLARAIAELYRYYGFQGTESLHFEREQFIGGQTKYTYRQYINGIKTPQRLEVIVSDRTGRIERLQGWLMVDRGYTTEPSISEEQAIKAALQLAQSRQEELGGAPIFHLAASGVYTELEYSGWNEDGSPQLIYAVYVPYITPIEGGSSHELFHVKPNGEAYSPGGVEYLNNARACESSGTVLAWCNYQGNNPLVVYSDGTCSWQYDSDGDGNCDSEHEQYKKAADLAKDVLVMWEDLWEVGCCDVGTITNPSNGGNIDINIGAPIEGDVDSPNPSAAYGWSSDGYAVIIINPDLVTTDGQLAYAIAHEMGHQAYHASSSTFFLDPDAPNVVKERTQKAVREFIADFNAIMFQNYNGPNASSKFTSNPNWVTNAGHDYSQQFNVTNMSSQNTSYKNARVGGHAMYELVARVGPEVAAYIFLKSVPFLQDSDGDKWVSWLEVRGAMEQVAAELGVTQVRAVQDAWADVGVGVEAPPITQPVFAPLVPTGVQAIARAPYCENDGHTHYDLYWNLSSGATYYKVWYTKNGIIFNYMGQRTQSPSVFWTKVDANYHVSACSADGCSVLSSGAPAQALCN